MTGASRETVHVETDVLVIGSGAAGLYAAIEAADAGQRVLLADRSLIGRGGATVMAQMTVAVALEELGDDPECHFQDTLTSGRGLCDPALSHLLTYDGPAVIRQLDAWGVGWARADGKITAAFAPGHDRARCVYVDFLATGPAVSKTMRTAAHKRKAVRRAGDLVITDLLMHGGAVTGALAWHAATGDAVTIAAKATVIATGGLTRLYRRNSASANMSGDGYALALRAGAPLVDMEFVQFFPIGHLAPRLIGMDPIMWDPFRYKLGGKLLNGRMEEFTERYGAPDGGRYVITRDVATHAILGEVAAGRGSPHGGAYLSFQHVPAAKLREAFGPVIDRLAENGIDLTRMPVEVAPIAHYHMGGVRAGADMATVVPGLFVAGEAVGGANGANRLSGNAITEALAFGCVAGRSAARLAKESRAVPVACPSDEQMVLLRPAVREKRANTAALIQCLQATMADDVGPARTHDGLARARSTFDAIEAEAGTTPAGSGMAFDMERLDWLDLRTMLQVARCVTQAALARTESRGAHQREDFPGLDEGWTHNQEIRLRDGGLHIAKTPVGAPAPREAALA